MSMFSEVAIESTVQGVVRKINERIAANAQNPDVVQELKLIGRHALGLFDYASPDWVKEFERLFAE